MRRVTALAILAASSTQAQDFSSMTYHCDRGIEVPATYVVGPQTSLVVIHVDGRQVTLTTNPAGSPDVFSRPSEGSGYIWWTEGDNAALLWKTADGELPLLSCAIAKAPQD